MATTAQFATSVLYLTFLLIPGYATLRAFYFTYISLDDLSRLDKIATIIIGGFLSLMIVVALYRLNIPLLVNEVLIMTTEFGNPNENYTIRDKVIISGNIKFGLLDAGILILFQCLVGTALGYGYGIYRRNLEHQPQTREELVQPWERAYEIANVGETIVIVTTQNKTIEGEIQQMGSPSKNYDILLSSPREVRRSFAGDTIEVVPLGDYSYHHYRDISRIEFGDEKDSIYDPDANTRGNRKGIDEVRTRMTVLTETLIDGSRWGLHRTKWLFVGFMKVPLKILVFGIRFLIGIGQRLPPVQSDEPEERTKSEYDIEER